jgi:hypothetical protein
MGNEVVWYKAGNGRQMAQWRGIARVFYLYDVYSGLAVSQQIT